MGNNRSPYKRKLSTSEKEVIIFTDNLFRGIRYGFVTFPRFIGYYKTTILAAYTSNFSPLLQAIKNIENRSSSVKLSDSDSDTLIRYKGGMAGHYLSIHTVLVSYRELLEEYWSLCNASITSCGFSKLGTDDKQYYQVWHRKESTVISNYRKGSRERI